MHFVNKASVPNMILHGENEDFLADIHYRKSRKCFVVCIDGVDSSSISFDLPEWDRVEKLFSTLFPANNLEEFRSLAKHQEVKGGYTGFELELVGFSDGQAETLDPVAYPEEAYDYIQWSIYGRLHDGTAESIADFNDSHKYLADVCLSALQEMLK